MTANPTNQINKRTMKFEKEFNEAHPEMIGEKDRAFYESNYMDWLEDQYITANSLEPKTEQPTGETVYKKVETDCITCEMHPHLGKHCMFCGGTRKRISYEEITLPTQSAKSGEQDMEDEKRSADKWASEQAKLGGAGKAQELALSKGYFWGRQSVFIDKTNSRNKEEIIKWIGEKKKKCINVSELKMVSEFESLVLSLPSPPPAQREEGEAVRANYDIRKSVSWFAEQMEGKLRENDHKGGWLDCTPTWLLRRMQSELNEIQKAISKKPKDTEEIVKECADVANFAMMIADKVRNRYGK